MTTTAPRSRLRAERRRRRWRSLLVAVVSFALVATAVPALALRFADVTTAGTQVFPAVGSATSTGPATTATWSTNGVSRGAQETWPWTGAALASQFTPAGEVGAELPPSPVAQSFSTTCALASLLTSQCQSGTITLSFSRPVTNPELYVAGLGNRDSLIGISSSQSAARLMIESARDGTNAANVRFANLYSANEFGSLPSMQLNGGRLEARATRPGTQCDAQGEGVDVNGRAGCGRVRLAGTFTSVTFRVSIRIDAQVLTLALVPADTFSLSVALTDQPLPTATPTTATTSKGVPVTIDLGPRVTPATRPDGTTVPITSWTIVPGNGWSSASSARTWTSAAGSIQLSESGVATFQPAPGFVGPAPAATYRVTDREASTATSTVSVTVTEPTPPQLSITKTASSPLFTPGEPASYAVTVTNAGQTATPASTVVSDSLPTGVAYQSFAGSDWSCVPGAPVVCTHAGALSPGASTTLTLAVVPSAAAVTGTNTATVSGGGDATCPAAARCSSTVQVAIASPTIATSKVLSQVNGAPAIANQTVLPGDVLTWTITVGNTGTGSGSTVLRDVVPAGTTRAGATSQGWSCGKGAVAGTACEQTVTVAAGASATRTFTATVVSAPPTSIVNTVTSSLGTCAACTVTTAVAPLVPVVKSVETQGRPALPGGAVVPYTLTFTNAGTVAGYLDYDDVLAGVLDDSVWPTDAGGAPVAPTVTPSGSVTAVFDPAAQRITVSGSVPAGQTVQVTYAVQVREWAAIVADSSDALLRNAVVRSGAAPPASCAAGSPTCLETPLASYSLVTGATPSPADQVDPGVTITPSVAVVSHPRSTGPVTGVRVVDTLTEVLDGADFVTGSAVLTVSGVATPLPDLAPVLDPLTQQWTLTSPTFTLPAAATATLTYAVTVQPDAWFAQLRNVAGVTGGLAPTTCPVVSGPQPPVSVVAPACQTVHQVTGLIEIQKTGLDGDGELVDMPGSTFAVHGVLEGPTGPSLGPVSTAVVPVPDPDRTGRAVVAGIPIGTHYLAETAAPAGYSLLAQPVLIEVTADRTVVVAQDEAPTVLASNPPAPAFPLVTVRDVPRFVMPEAGGGGSTPFRVLGLGLLGGAAALLMLLDLRRRAGSAALRPEGRAAAPPG